MRLEIRSWDRAQCGAMLAVVAAANAVWGAWGQVHPVVWFALFALGMIAFERPESTSAAPVASDAPLDNRDLMVLVPAVAAVLLPVPALSALAVLLTGCWLYRSGGAASRARRCGVVVLALTGVLIWSHVFFAAAGPQLMAADARFVMMLSGTEARGNLLDFASEGPPMLIGYACSSLHNITKAVLFWAAMTQLLRIPIGKGSLLVCLAAIAVNALVNALRLSTIAHNRESFDYWHLGLGGAMFAWAGVIAVLLVVAGGCHALTKSQR